MKKLLIVTICVLCAGFVVILISAPLFISLNFDLDFPSQALIYPSNVPDFVESIDEQQASRVFESIRDNLRIYRQCEGAQFFAYVDEVPNGKLLDLYLTVDSAIDITGREVLLQRFHPVNESLFSSSYSRTLGNAATTSFVLDMDVPCDTPILTRGTLKALVPKRVIKVTWDQVWWGTTQAQDGIEFTLAGAEKDTLTVTTQGAKYPALCVPMIADNSNTILGDYRLEYEYSANGDARIHIIPGRHNPGISKVHFYQVLEVWEREIPFEIDAMVYRSDNTLKAPLKPRYLKESLSELTTRLDMEEIRRAIVVEPMPLTNASWSADFAIRLPVHGHSFGVQLSASKLFLSHDSGSAKVNVSSEQSTFKQNVLEPLGIYQSFSVFGTSLPSISWQIPPEHRIIRRADGVLRLRYPIQYAMEELSTAQAESTTFVATFSENLVRIHARATPDEATTAAPTELKSLQCEAFDSTGQRLAPMRDWGPGAFATPYWQEYAGTISKVRVYSPIEEVEFEYPVALSAE